MNALIRAEVDLDAIRHNVNLVRGRLGNGTRLCAVVKGDAYSHGVAGVWPVIAAGVDRMAVATLDEGRALRDAGYAGPLLIMFCAGTWDRDGWRDGLLDMARRDATFTIAGPRDVESLRKVAAQLGRAVHAHVEIDTGMHRSGVAHAAAAALIRAVAAEPGLNLTGVFTHFAMAGAADPEPTRHQLLRFNRALAAVRPGADVVRHCANSAAALRFPETHLDMVRVGLILYGWRTGEAAAITADRLAPQPALRVTAPIMQVHRAAAGEGVGYDLTHCLRRDSRLALVPAGFADGYARVLSDRAQVRIGREAVAVIGRVSMDQITIDITDIPAADVGTEVELVSNDPTAPNSVTALAALAGTNPYEILTGLRAKRIEHRYRSAAA